MIKRTPQEIADFFQCYVAQDESGEWYMYKDIPIRNNCRGIWVGSIEDPLRFPYKVVEIPSNHFWTHLYEPRKSIKSENSVLDTRNQPETAENSVITSDSGTNQQGANYQKEADSDNKPDSYYQDSPISDNKPGHLGEVYTHKEYRIVTAHKEIDSESFAKGVMAWVERGWIPTGGISFDKQGCPYQAMVRGI